VHPGHDVLFQFPFSSADSELKLHEVSKVTFYIHWPVGLLITVNILSISNGKDLDLFVGFPNEIKYPVIANPDSGAFPAMKSFYLWGIGICLQGKNCFYDFIVDLWGKVI
jgi:hypothetical protein